MVHEIFISLSIFISSIIILILIYRYCIIVCNGFHLDNILFFFMLNYIVYAFIGAVLFNVFYLSHGLSYHIYENPIFLIFTWGIVLFGLIFIPISIKILNPMITKTVPYNLNDFSESKIEKIVFYSIFVFCLLILYVYSRKIGGIPLLRYIGNRKLSQAFLRSEATNNFSGHAWRYTLFYKNIPYILLIVSCFSPYKKFRNILIVYNAFISVMNFEKGPLINLLILLLIIYFRKKGKIKIGIVLLSGFVSSVLIIFMYIFFMNSSGSLGTILIGALGRVFVGQILCFPWYMRYAEINGFIWGTSFPNPHGIFPFEVNRITVNVMNLYKESYGINNGVVGSMPTVFPAEWFVNFGWPGIFLSFILFVLIMSFLMRFCNYQLKKYNDKYAEAIFIYIIVYLAKYVGTSFTGIIIDTELIIPILLLLVLRKIRKSVRVSKYRYK